VILSFIFLTPKTVFHDRPDPFITEAADDNGNPHFVVKEVTEQAAVARLRSFQGDSLMISKTEPVYDTTGALVAYSIWVDRKK
jgi:hypothetical protein